MKTEEKILEILYKKSSYTSGKEIAASLGISRNSVWKAINKLKSSGYDISSSVNGYLMEKNIFDEYSIKKELKREHKLYLYKEESSSNTVAKKLCLSGEPEGSVVIVESQTNGRGRMGRSFLSSSENGLYMSIILRPQIPSDKCVNITVAGAVAVAQAIEELSEIVCQIKWVNDIYIKEKKCCGILTEAAINFESGMLDYAIIGIGVNLCPPKGGFDKEIEEIACGVYENEYPQGFKSKLCAAIVNNFFDHYELLTEKKYIKEYKDRSNIIGKDVDVYVGERVISGIAVDIDDNASLVVKDALGTLHIFNSGEARVRKQGKSL